MSAVGKGIAWIAVGLVVMTGCGIAEASNDSEAAALVTKARAAQWAEVAKFDRQCAAWNRVMVARWDRVKTSRQWTDVGYRGITPDVAHPAPEGRTWCDPTPEQDRAAERARHRVDRVERRWARAHPGIGGSDGSGGSVTLSGCIGHHVRLCARS
jgi:hypothetical protein